MSVVLGLAVVYGSTSVTKLLADSSYDSNGNTAVRSTPKIVLGKDWAAALAGDQASLLALRRNTRQSWIEACQEAVDAGDCEIIVSCGSHRRSTLYHVGGDGAHAEVYGIALIPQREIETVLSSLLSVLGRRGWWIVKGTSWETLLCELALFAGGIPPFWYYSSDIGELRRLEPRYKEP